MAKTKKSQAVIVTRQGTESPESPPSLQNERVVIPTITNGFGEAIGFGGGPGIGGGVNPGFFSGSGTPGVQPVSDTTTAFENLRWYLVSNFRQLLSQLFVEIGLVKTIVCVPVDDGLRGGVMFKSKQLDEQQLKDLQLNMDREGDINTAGWAVKWTRLYGGGGILILVDDQDPQEPLDLDSITKDTKVTFRAVDMWELYWDQQNVEGYDAEIQEEDFEHYSYYSEPVHKSRVLPLKGSEAPSFIRPRLRGWGVSEVEVLIRSMNQYLKSTDLTFEVLDEFKLDVYKIKNLVNTLLSPDGTTKIRERVQMTNWQKNYQNAIVMDSEDEFDHKQLSFSGLAEAQAGIRMQAAADMRIPIIKLFGQSESSGGLGTSSSEEMENYNAMVEGEVRGKIKYPILRIAEIKCQQLFGFIPDDLELEFKPLRELSATDQETVKTQKFARLEAAAARGAVTTQEWRDAANKGNLFDIQLDTSQDSLDDADSEIDEVAAGDGAGEPADKGADGKEGQGSDAPDSEKMSQGDNPKMKNIFGGLTVFNSLDIMKRFFNSSEFDKASYEADGGDSWIEDGRKELFENPGGVDEGLWKKAEDASQKAFGEKRWKFVTWWYKKQGGKFS